MRILLMIVILMVVTNMASAQDVPTVRSGFRPDAPPYAIRGPYPVGFRALTTGTGADALSVAVWYPALNADGLEEKITYPAIPAKFEGMPPDQVMPSYGHALQDAAVDLSGGPYPVVIYSHGFAGHSYGTAYLLEHLASQGFVVLAPDHLEMWDPLYKDIPMSSVQRPLAIRQTIGFGEELTAAGGVLAGMIDTNTIAVVGHSYGGFTSLLMGGARFDFEALKATCAPLAPDHTIGVVCAPLLEKQAEMAQMAGLDAIPQGLWPSWSDPRIKAIVPMAAETELIGAAGLAEIKIPVLLINGTGDQTVPLEWGATPTWEYIGSSRKASVLFANADHSVIVASCSDFPWPLAIGWFAGCSDPVWDLDRAHDLYDHFITAFLLAELKGDAQARAALQPAAVSFPGISYEAVGYSD